MADLNDGKLWSDMDVNDLRSAATYGRTLEETAEFLCRSSSLDDVAAKAKDIGVFFRSPAAAAPSAVEVVRWEGSDGWGVSIIYSGGVRHAHRVGTFEQATAEAGALRESFERLTDII